MTFFLLIPIVVVAVPAEAQALPQGNVRCVERWHGETECRDAITNQLVSICRKQSDGTWICRKP
jgi:hypothetical protein